MSFDIKIWLSSTENGDHLFFHENKNLWQKYTVKNDNLEGEYVEFHSNEILMKKGNFSNGLKQGEWLI